MHCRAIVVSRLIACILVLAVALPPGSAWAIGASLFEDAATVGAATVSGLQASTRVLSSPRGVVSPLVQPEVTLANPTTVTIPEADDYAKLVLGDPWDMNELTDIRKERSFNLTSIGVSDGILTAVSGTDSNPNNLNKNPGNPQISLMYPGYVGSYNVGKLGVNYPINAGYYRQLSFRMYLSEAYSGDVAGVYWATDQTFTSYGYANRIPVYPGWNTYVLDIPTLERTAGNTSWAGTVHALRLDPISRAGVTIKLDWVRLTPADTSSTRQTVSWTATDSSATMGLYAALNNTDTTASGRYSRIGTVSASASSYQWGTSMVPPGTYYVRSETGYDWATMVRGNAWDMNESSGAVDIYTNGGFGPANTSYSLSGGALSGTTTGTTNAQPPTVFLSFPPYTPINGSDYHHLTISLNKPAGYGFLIAWATSDNPSGMYSYYVDDLTGGWKSYSVDLRTAGASNPWAGKQITYLRVDPIRDYGSSQITPNLSWAINWVALTAGLTPTGEPDLAPSVAFSPGTVTVNSAPFVELTKPSMLSGPDYAETELGNGWDMGSVADMPSLSSNGITGIMSHGQRANCSDFSRDDINAYNFDGGVLNATTWGTLCVEHGVATSNPQLWLNTGVVNNLTDDPIDTSKYKYATLRFKLDGTQDTTNGWVNRLIWLSGPDPNSAEQNLSVMDDIIIDEGWNTYTLDLSRAALEPYVGDARSDYGWRERVKFFRFDPNEVAASTNIHLDYIKLTGDDVAGDSYPITWTAGGNSGATVDLYWSLSSSNTGLRPITTGVPASNGSYTWNTTTVRGASNITARVYVYATVGDGYNSSTAVSRAPVVVSLDAANFYQLFLPVLTKVYGGGW